MNRPTIKHAAVAIATFALTVAAAAEVYADGTEFLGPPSITIANGSGLAAAGTGIEAADGSTMNAGTVSIDIAAGQTPIQVLAYWEGFFEAGTTRPATFDLMVDGSSYTGQLIGGYVTPRGLQFAAYRSDVTGIALVPGTNDVTLTGFADVADFEGNGAGLLVIYDDGTMAEIALFDGSDRAFFNSPPPTQATEPVVFDFPPAAIDRVADVKLFFADVSGTRSGGGFRPTSIVVTVGAGPEQEFNNLLDSVDGTEWDTVNLAFDIPAGNDSVTVQALSEDRAQEPDTGNPASFTWITAGLSISVPGEGGQGCTPGYWKQRHHFGNWTAPYDPRDPFSSVFEDAFPGMTLVEVLRQGGGGLNALGRHTVAALLNAASADVDYDLRVGEVIRGFNAVYPSGRARYNALKNRFERFNEQGCPLGRAELPGDSKVKGKKGKKKGKGKNGKRRAWGQNR